MDKSFSDIPSFFISWLNGQTFYRPLSREIYNLLMYRSFGLNPIPFHIINLLLVLIEGVLLCKISQVLFNKTKITLVALLVFFISPIHNIELYYLASVQTLFSAVFQSAALYFFISRDTKRNYYLSVIFYIFAIFSHESAMVFPGILFIFTLLDKKKDYRRLLPFLLIGGARVVLFLVLKALPDQLVYRPVFGLKPFLNTLMWYGLWSFGLSEIMPDFLGSGLKLNPNFLKWYPEYSRIVFPAIALLILGLSVVATLSFKRMNKKTLFVLSISYILSLSPFLFFPNHKFAYYLSFPLILLSLGVGYLCSSFKGKSYALSMAALILLLLTITYETTKLNQVTYWAAKRAKAAQFIMKDVKTKVPGVGESQAIYIQKDPNYPDIAKEWGSSSKQAFYILSGSDAFKLLYNNPTLKVYFEDVNSPQVGVEVIPYVATFPY